MKIDLAPIDYYFYRPHLYTIQFAFEYESKISMEKVAVGVRRLLKQMPILGSRLLKVSNFKVVFELGHEIPIREQQVEGEILDSSEQLYDTVSNTDGEPLIKILVSHTERRSYVGISFSHMLGDGASFFMFMEYLSRAINSETFHVSISSDRSKLNAYVQTSKTDLFDSTGYIRPRPKNPHRVDVENILYSFAELEEMKDLCKTSGVKVSTNDIVMADLTKRFHKSIPLFNNRFIVRCPVDYRNITGIGQNYFGNAVKDAVTTFIPEDLDGLTLPLIANTIRKSIDSINQNSVKESLTALDSFRQENGISAFQDLGCPGLLVSNLSKFPISEIDLGSGKPCNFHHASLNPRLALILPASNGLLVKFKRPGQESD